METKRVTGQEFQQNFDLFLNNVVTVRNSLCRLTTGKITKNHHSRSLQKPQEGLEFNLLTGDGQEYIISFDMVTFVLVDERALVQYARDKRTTWRCITCTSDELVEGRTPVEYREMREQQLMNEVRGLKEKQQILLSKIGDV